MSDECQHQWDNCTCVKCGEVRHSIENNLCIKCKVQFKSCPNCAGEGAVERQTGFAWYQSGNQLGEDEFVKESCDVCDGLGYVVVGG